MKKRTQKEERQKRQGLPYGLLILAMLIFGTNGLLYPAYPSRAVRSFSCVR